MAHRCVDEKYSRDFGATFITVQRSVVPNGRYAKYGDMGYAEANAERNS